MVRLIWILGGVVVALVLGSFAFAYPKVRHAGYEFHSDLSIDALQIVQSYPEEIHSKAKSVALQADAAAAFFAMRDAALLDDVQLLALSGFRNHADQQKLFENKIVQLGEAEALKRVAPGGYSEHHTGYVLDFAERRSGEYFIDKHFVKSKQYKWLAANASRFGYELSYPEASDSTIFEPWHWRYVGSKAARETFYRREFAIMFEVLRYELRGSVDKLHIGG